MTGAGSVANRRRGSRSDCSVQSKSSWTAAVLAPSTHFACSGSWRCSRCGETCQHRSRLAFELWPDSDERQARTNLRKLLHDFRHSLPDIGEFVQIDNEIVRWIPTGPSEVDVLRFRDAMAAGDLELAARLVFGRSPSRLLRRLGHGRASEASSRGVRGPGAAERRGCRARRPRSDDQACPDASSTWSRPTKWPFESRWKHISRSATEARRCAPTTGTRRCSSVSWRWNRARPSVRCTDSFGPTHEPARTARRGRGAGRRRAVRGP